MRLLITRPEQDGSRTAALLRDRGHEAVLAPLLRIEPVDDPDWGVGPWTALLLTSANGARAIAAHRRFAEMASLPVLAVGESTAEAARAAGFADVESAGGDGGDLARLAARRFPKTPRPLLYLAGADRARDLGEELAAAGLSLETVSIYRAVAVDALPGLALTALAEATIEGVLHFSRRSVDAYLRCAGADLVPALAPVHFCLSERAAEPLRAAGATRVLVAESPDEAALLALVTTPP